MMRQATLLRSLVEGSIVALALIAAPCASAEPQARNQASTADTLILPAQDRDATNASDSKLAAQMHRKIGVERLASIALVDADVDPDGCMTAPLAAGSVGDNRRREGMEALAAALRRRGVVVTVLSSDAVRLVDQAEQRRVRAIRGSSSLAFGEGEGRWFATKAELVACARVDPDEPRHKSLSHPALAAELAALHQDVVLAVNDSKAESKGPSWNVIEGVLSSDGKSLDAGTSSAKVAATMVLKDGSVAWKGEGLAEGRLRPPLDAQAFGKLKAYMEGEFRMMAQYRTAHPASDRMPPIDEEAFDAIVSGDLDHAPAGSTLGPSVDATVQAAAERIVDQLRSVLPSR